MKLVLQHFYQMLKHNKQRKHVSLHCCRLSDDADSKQQMICLFQNFQVRHILPTYADLDTSAGQVAGTRWRRS